MSSLAMSEHDDGPEARCYYTGRAVPVEDPDVSVSISREAVLQKIDEGDTRLTS